MGKQAATKAALANALNTSGLAKAAPKQKEPAKDASKEQAPRRKKEPPPPKVVEKTKKEIEEEQRQLVKENQRKREEFYTADAARKAAQREGADVAVTYVEDRDTRKPKAVSDISEYWKVDLGILPFMPSDNVGPVEVPVDIDINDRLEYLQLFNDQLRQLLRMRFHVFWSQVIYDGGQVLRALDSFLRFCLRVHDVAASAEAHPDDGPLTESGLQITREISARVLAILVRLSRAEETSHDFMSAGKLGELIYEHRIFDVPRLIDICAIYGDSNRDTVTRIVHSVFSLQPQLQGDFQDVVGHMFAGLKQCCAPLQQQESGAGVAAQPTAKGAPELGVDECLTFLPDVISCFNAVFCFFPEACVERLVAAGAAGDAASERRCNAGADLPLVKLMVVLYDSLQALERRGGQTRLADIRSVFGIVRSLLCRLLCCILGFRLAPRHGEGAFAELLDWCRAHDEHGAFLHDLGRYGLENVAAEWHASGLVDEAQMDFLEQLCGPLLPPDARKKRVQRPSAVSAAGTSAVAASSSSSSAAAAASTAATAGSSSRGMASSDTAGGAANDAAKIREICEVVGPDFGEGFILQCLLHYGFSVPTVVGAILDGSLPPQLETLPRDLPMGADPTSASGLVIEPSLERKLSSDDKRRIVEQAGRLDREAEEAAAQRVAEDREYDDDVDENFGGGAVRVGRAESHSESDGDEDEGASSDEAADRWGGVGAKNGKGKGKGRGKPVQGQTIQARRKEENKSFVANHNRRALASRKMAKGMM